jgi:hypothetical protein
MSNRNAKGKAKYESPILVPLGEMAKGSGVCTTGSSVAFPACSAGSSHTGGVSCSTGSGFGGAVIDCTAGATATRACTAGATANTACTAGPSNNGGTCSAGGSASPTCTGGAAPG